MSTKFPPSVISSHARSRVLERFKIAPSELLELLNTGLGKRIGVSAARSHLVHRLVWSHVDGEALIAIQDIVLGTVLTVLPVEMYREEYEANLTESRLQHVLNQMVHAGLAPRDQWMPGDKEEYVTVFARLANSSQQVALGRWRGPVECVDLSILGAQDAFWSWVTQEISERGHAVHELETICAKFTGGDHQSVPYCPQEEDKQRITKTLFN